MSNFLVGLFAAHARKLDGRYSISAVNCGFITRAVRFRIYKVYEFI